VNGCSENDKDPSVSINVDKFVSVWETESFLRTSKLHGVC
jgi:hypothetical protein